MSHGKFDMAQKTMFQRKLKLGVEQKEHFSSSLLSVQIK